MTTDEAAVRVIVHLGELIIAADAAIKTMRDVATIKATRGNPTPFICRHEADRLEAALAPVKQAMIRGLNGVI